jgi:LPXTG-site transpeptidase (sortase) family protein
MKKYFKKSLYYYFGNLLILISLCGFIALYFPILRLYFFPPHQAAYLPQSNGYAISVPKISASAKIIPHVDPWNEDQYTKALQQGVAQAKGTALPGQKGTIFLFAHSSGPPWEQTYYNTLFLRLGELRPGDKIYLYHGQHRYTYQVMDKKVVWPNQVQYLQNKGKNQLILQTCTPIGTSLQRLLVFAVPQT